LGEVALGREAASAFNRAVLWGVEKTGVEVKEGVDHPVLWIAVENPNLRASTESEIAHREPRFP
jgi:hypothetical protein